MKVDATQYVGNHSIATAQADGERASKFIVSRYFDDHLEKNISEHKSIEEAKQVANKLNKQASGCYVNYVARTVNAT